MHHMRVVIEGLACRSAAELGAERAARQGPALIEAGRKALASGCVAKMTVADMRFHEFLYALSGNPSVGASLATRHTCTHRVMGELLLRDANPRDIWDQRAETLAHQRIKQASGFMVSTLRGNTGGPIEQRPTGRAWQRRIRVVRRFFAGGPDLRSHGAQNTSL